MTIPDRVAFTLFGKDIYWYGVLMAVGIILAVLLANREEKRKKLPSDIIIDMCLVIIPCGVVGARLYGKCRCNDSPFEPELSFRNSCSL